MLTVRCVPRIIHFYKGRLLKELLFLGLALATYEVGGVVGDSL